MIQSYSNMTRVIINPFGRSLPIQKRVWVLFKTQFVSKMNCERFIKQSACKKIYFIKSWPLLVSKVSRLKRLWENQICLWKLYLSEREMNLNQFENKYQNPFDVNSFLKMICFTKQRFSKRLWFPKPTSKDQPQLEI